MGSDKTKEPQYQVCLDARDESGLAPLGLMASYTWQHDPRHLVFLLSRYKFIAKMLTGRQPVLEVGCADAFGTRLVIQEVERLTAVDFDAVFIEDAKQRTDPKWPFDCHVHDMLEGPVSGSFDGAYALDVIEHIEESKEDRFVGNIVNSLTEHGVLLIGTPSLESQAHASPPSKAGHVNCKTADSLRLLMSRFFENVFVFSMNDEMVHTGYAPMAHYLIALCCSKRAV